MTNKTLDIMREYIRVADMCKGTALQGNEGKCVRFKLANGSYQSVGSLSQFVYLVENNNPSLELCVAVLEDKPVFVGSVIYNKYSALPFTINGNEKDYSMLNHWSWTKPIAFSEPTPKRTFELNGVELPCPDKDSDYSAIHSLSFFGTEYKFKSIDDRSSVVLALKKLLEEARDK